MPEEERDRCAALRVAVFLVGAAFLRRKNSYGGSGHRLVATAFPCFVQ